MNDEIKEILDKWKCYIGLTKKFTTNEYEMLRVEDIDKLLDYITNLQQEIEKLNDDKRGMLVQLYKANDNRDKVKQENERLKENNSDMQEEMARTWQKCDDLQQENERLKQLVDADNESYDIQEMIINRQKSELLEQEDYKSRCEKASEYIKSNPNVFYDENLIDVETLLNNEYTDEYAGEIRFISTLLNILQNGSEKDE